MGGLFGGTTKQTTNSTTDTGPSKFQLPYLTDAFNAAQANFKTQQGTPYYQGQTFAGMSDGAKSTLDSLKDYASGAGLGAANTLSSIGSNLAGYATKAGTTIDDYLKAASEDPTQALTESAKAYAANPNIDALIDANSRDVTRNLNESTLPSLNRQASGTGNINSSRAGIAEGLARRGAEDRIGDISATIRSDAYNRGLDLASRERSNKLNAMGSAASAYQGLAGTGISALTSGVNAGYGAFNAINGANATEQADRQGQMDADFKKWAGEDTRNADLLKRYYDIIGSNAWGTSGTSSGTSTTKQSGGALSGILGLASTGLGLAGGLGWTPFK